MKFDIEKLEVHLVPGLSDMFEDAAREVFEIIQEADSYEAKGDRVTPTVQMEVAFEYDVKTGHAAIEAKCHVKRPRKKAISRAIHIREGNFWIEPDHPDQVVMFNGDKE